MLNNQGDAKVEGERIIRVLKDSITNMKMMFALQYMDEQAWTGLENHMDSNDFKKLVIFCSKYRPDMRRIPSIDGTIQKIDDSSSKLSEVVEPNGGDGNHDEEIQKAMKIITKNENSANFLLKIYKENEPNPFLSDMDLFSKYMEEKIHQTPQMEKKLDSRMAHLHQENETLKEQVAALRAKANLLRKKQNEVLIDKDEILKNSQLKINMIRKNTQDYITEKIEESEARMIRDWAMSERAQADMSEDLKQQTLYFENAQKEQMVKEKECRAQRAKAEAQLVALLQQYDTDIGNRHEEKEQLTAALAKEREQLEMLQEQFDEQEVEYLQLMNEKEKYERDVWNEKIYQIQCKIAARKIQRCFRRYLERSKSRKKGKRGRGKARKNN
ncbi:hypothetical protein LSTR_LSTR000431 [Laodelphax striatellus]|uniref:Dynein regulatory complex protein 10 n=1 Tax=Laodelphax striatellus TaxID=195883 RepID=A0A482X4E1_LAOST|nr:hypothetical protein LSTR_LSTR000431 [Laodelphax striatellus]